MCSCGLLECWAKDPRMPFSYNPQDGCYDLQLSPTLIVHDVHCVFCGGHPQPFEAKCVSPCACGQLEHVANNPEVPIVFIDDLDEYHLLWNSHYLMIYYCPYCGGSVPQSKSRDQFTSPSEDEMKSFLKRVEKLRTIDEVVAILGEPDERHGASGAYHVDDENWGLEYVKQTLVFRNVAQTMDVYIQELFDKKFAIVFSGKYKKDKRDEKRGHH